MWKCRSHRDTVWFACNQDGMYRISKQWLLLDTSSSMGYSYKPNLLDNLRSCVSYEVIKAITNETSIKLKHIGDLNIMRPQNFIMMLILLPLLLLSMMLF